MENFQFSPKHPPTKNELINNKEIDFILFTLNSLQYLAIIALKCAFSYFIPVKLFTWKFYQFE